MTLENALLAAIGSVTSALVIVVKVLWQRSEQCEKDRAELRIKIEEVKESAGKNQGLLLAYEMCPIHNCPFKIK